MCVVVGEHIVAHKAAWGLPVVYSLNESEQGWILKRLFVALLELREEAEVAHDLCHVKK